MAKPVETSSSGPCIRLFQGNTPTFYHKEDKWDMFCTRFEQNLLLYDEKTISKDQKRAIFLNSLHEETFSFLVDLCIPKKVTDVELNELFKTLKEYCDTEINIYEGRKRFFLCKQFLHESVKEFAVRLRKLSYHCKFEERLDETLKDIFILNLINFKIQDKLVAKPEDIKNIKFEEIVKMASLCETFIIERESGESTTYVINKSAAQLQSHSRFLNSSVDNNVINRFDNYNNTERWFDSDRKGKLNLKSSEIICFRCGLKGHIKTQCRVNLNNRKKTETGEIKSIFTMHENNEDFNVQVRLENIIMSALIDSGASVCVMPAKIYKQFFNRIILLQYNSELKGYADTQLSVLGAIIVEVEYKNTNKHLQFVVVDHGREILLGRDFMREFGIIFSGLQVASLRNTSHKEQCTATLKSRVPEVIGKTIGRFSKNEVGVERVKNHLIKFCNPRPVPIALRDKVKDKLERSTERQKYCYGEKKFKIGAMRVGESVLVKDFRPVKQRNWVYGTIMKVISDKVYLVKVRNLVWKRHFDQLKYVKKSLEKIAEESQEIHSDKKKIYWKGSHWPICWTNRLMNLFLHYGVMTADSHHGMEYKDHAQHDGMNIFFSYIFFLFSSGKNFRFLFNFFFFSCSFI
jgi:hypothetical protein